MNRREPVKIRHCFIEDQAAKDYLKTIEMNSDKEDHNNLSSKF